MRSSNGQRRLLPVAALVLALMTLLWQGSALAGFGDVGTKPGSESSGESGTVSEESETTESEESEPSETEKAPAPTNKVESGAVQEPPEEEEPTGGATAVGTVAHVGVGGNEIITASQSSSSAHDDSCSADATALSILGQELFGAHAECAAGQETVDESALIDICEESGGQLCVAVLYSYAQTNDSEEESSGQSHSDIASACVGGEQPTPRDNCDGPVGAKVGHSESQSRRNKQTGEAEAHQESSLVEVCLGGTDPETGVCDGLGVVLLHSEGSGIARPGEDAEMSGESYILNIQAQGEENKIGDDEVDIPGGCNDEEDPSLCISLNDGDVTVEAGKGANHQEVVGLDVGDLITGSVDEGTITADSAKEPVERVPPKKPPKPQPPKKKKPLPAPTGPALATTGASIIPAALFGTVLVLLGMRLVARKPERQPVE